MPFFSRLHALIKRDYLRFHLLCAIGGIAGIPAGIWGIGAGLAVGFFSEWILKRISEENKYKTAVEECSGSCVDGEPFPASVYTCALSVYCSGSVQESAVHAKYVFADKYKADWSVLCRSAANASCLNGDLLVESIAKLVGEIKKENLPLDDIFRFISDSEFAWNETVRGKKPSVYLKELLDYSYVPDETAAAYHVLGLDENASFAQVKAAHRRLAAQYHPDTQKKSSPDTALFMRIQAAYELISAQHG